MVIQLGGRHPAVALHLLAATSLTCLSAPALAQTSPSRIDQESEQRSTEQELGVIRVVASALFAADTEQSTVGKPKVLTTTTTAATLRERMVDNLADYARRVDAGVNINGSNLSINIRGLDANRVLTTIDGVRTQWLSDGARGVQGGVTSFDFNGLGAIDVVKNADSSFFGTGALAGVVALRTLDPEALLAGDKKRGGLSKVTYDSTSDSVYLNQAAALRFGDTLLLVQAGYQNGAEIRNKGDISGTGTSRTERNPAAYDQGSLLVKLHQYLPGGHRFGLTGEIFSRDYDENTLTSIGTTYDRYRTDQQSKRKRIAGSYDYKADGEGAAIDEAHAVAYWQKQDLIVFTQANRLTAPKGEYDRDSDLKVRSYGFNGSLTSRFATGPLNHAITLGGEAFQTRSSQYAAGVDNCTPALPTCSFLHVNQSDMPDVDGTDLGIVVQDRITVGDGMVRLTPGVRYDWYKRTPKETPTYTANDAYEGLPGRSKDDHFSPKVLAELEPVRGLTLYGQWSEAFRAPSATELYLSYGGTGSYVSIGNPDLKSETSRGYEVGVHYGDGERGLRVSFYDNHYRNFIDTITTTAAAVGLAGSYPFGVFEYVNRARVRIYGAEASANWAFSPHLRMWSSIAYANGKDTDEDLHLNSIPPLRGILGVGYSRERFGADLSSTLAAARNKVENPASDLNKAPGYSIIDFSAWLSPGFTKGLKLQAGVYNLLDKTYYNALDIPDSATVKKISYTQPGRTFKVTALMAF